jgi:hypothetical protein
MLAASTLLHAPSRRSVELVHRIRLNPSEARLEVSALIANERRAQADALSQELLREHPSHEEALATRILVCEVMHRWQEAAGLLRQLLELQGNRAPAESWYHYVRVLNCLGDTPAARQACEVGLALHPAHPHFSCELERLDRDGASLGLEASPGADR